MSHRPRREPLDRGHLIAIDTGAAREGLAPLTGLRLSERQFLTVAGR